MRIALYHDLPSGGAKRSFQELIRRMNSRHVLDVFTLSCANHTFADFRPFVNDYRIYDFTPLPLFASPFGRINQVSRTLDLKRLKTLNKKIARDIQSESYDLILVNPCQFEKSPSVMRYTGSIPSVYYCHEPLRQVYEEIPNRPYTVNGSKRQQFLDQIDPFPGIYRRSLTKTDRVNINSADMILVNSHFTQSSIMANYQLESHVCYHGVDIDFFHPMGLDRQHVVVSVGSLTPLKSFDFIIQALGRIPSKDRPRLLIASNFQNPLERGYLQELAQKLGVSVDFLENIPDDKLVELYNQAKLTVYTPVREPFGLVPLESLACGTPVVAVGEGGVRETMIDGFTGLLVERDEKQLADAIMQLLSEPVLAARFGRNGREHVISQWSWEISVSKLENYLEACANANH